MAIPLPHSEVPFGKKLMATSIAAAKSAQKRTTTEPPGQESSKKMRTSSGSTASDAALRSKLAITHQSNELALEIPSMHCSTFDTSALRSEFLENGEEPETPVDGSHVIEIEDEAVEEAPKASNIEVAPNTIVSFVPSHLPHLIG